MRRVKFTKDFGVKRAGDVCEYDNSLASHLINVDKVAEETSDELTVVDSEREYIMPKPVTEESETKVEEEAATAEDVVETNSKEEDSTDEAEAAVEENPAVEEVVVAENPVPVVAEETSDEQPTTKAKKK